MRTVTSSIDAYIASFPREAQLLLNQMRATIGKAAPKAEEAIKYGIPAFVLNGKNLVFFAGYRNHIGFYPGAGGIAEFKRELSVFKSGKGSVQFPLDEPLPLSLVTRITKARVKACAAATASRKKTTTRSRPTR
jgi:uncharacterized protein YdhG (YjbR/CyaY superfamily)